MIQHATTRIASAPALRALAGLAVAATLLLAVDARAQQPPLTGRMLADPAAPPPPPAAAPASATPATGSGDEWQPPRALAPSPAPAPTRIGDATRALLQLQADGTHGGTRLPILGDQAAASYTRYLKSFEHEIPEYMKTNVRKDVSGSND
ncbi:DUF3613 domain-containing protein [Stenotrophomonas sp. GZD-301]|uniref:DUF3613 domain-containing protein n=1 Tax=Stenotrophomonas sp. GZD-301 TaxID=3404814 RepID=UPI003BB760BC